MRISIFAYVGLGCLLFSYAGCTKKANDSEKPLPSAGGSNSGTQTDDDEQSGDEGDAAANTQKPEPEKIEEPPAPTIPEVILSDAHLATCLVRVGDPLPDGKLVDLEGKEHSIEELLGEKLTVVMFWTAKRVYATEELMDLSSQIAAPFSGQGVKVVAVSVGDATDAAKKAVEEAEAANVQVLVDPEGTYFAKVATEKLPRVYLVDRDGKILWFDLEFSRSTRRELEQAINVSLAETPVEKPAT